MKKEEAELKKLIDREGFAYLEAFPFKVYDALTKATGTSKASCGYILLTLLSGLPSRAKAGASREELKQEIADKCQFVPALCEKLSTLYASLFSPDNQRAWEEQVGRGLNEFIAHDWVFTWEETGEWRPRHGGIPYECTAEGSATLEVADEEKVKKEILSKFTNPFLTEEEIYDYYDDLLRKKLSDDFEAFIQGDDYYEPTVEDFEYHWILSDFCKAHGFEITEWDYSGSGDYNPY